MEYNWQSTRDKASNGACVGNLQKVVGNKLQELGAQLDLTNNSSNNMLGDMETMDIVQIW